jgi:hypothetical protein
VARNAAKLLYQSAQAEKDIRHMRNAQVRSLDAPRCTAAMKKHNHSSDDRPIQYRGKYSRHSHDQALTEFVSDHSTGATCLKPSRRAIAARALALLSPACLSLN